MTPALISSDVNHGSWDQAPVVLVSGPGPGEMFDLRDPECALSADQLDQLKAASPGDFQGEPKCLSTLDRLAGHDR